MKDLDFDLAFQCAIRPPGEFIGRNREERTGRAYVAEADADCLRWQSLHAEDQQAQNQYREELQLHIFILLAALSGAIEFPSSPVTDSLSALRREFVRPGSC